MTTAAKSGFLSLRVQPDLWAAVRTAAAAEGEAAAVIVRRALRRELQLQVTSSQQEETA